ncbi:MAG: ankyrin repeat domain-containing protein [Halioglobus sp.]
MIYVTEIASVAARALATVSLALVLSPGASASPALLEAAAQGNVAEVNVLLEAGADIDFTLPNDTPKWGYLVSTALETASGKGHADVVELLLQKGAKTRTDKSRGLYAATWAGGRGHTETLLLLLKHENPDAEHLNPLFGPALIGATRNQHLTTIRALLTAGVDPNWYTPRGSSPKPAILIAAAPGHEETFLILLEAGADPKPHPDILSYTSGRADTVMVQRLLDLGMDPNDKGDYGQPLAVIACSSVAPPVEWKKKIVATSHVLIAAGSEVNVPWRGRSPLFCARETRNEELVKLLEANGAEAFETLARKLKRKGLQGIYTIGNH